MIHIFYTVLYACQKKQHIPCFVGNCSIETISLCHGDQCSWYNDYGTLYAENNGLTLCNWNGDCWNTDNTNIYAPIYDDQCKAANSICAYDMTINNGTSLNMGYIKYSESDCNYFGGLVYTTAVPLLVNILFTIYYW